MRGGRASAPDSARDLTALLRLPSWNKGRRTRGKRRGGDEVKESEEVRGGMGKR